MEFAFDQTLRPTILLDATMLQCFAALPTKLCPESSHIRAVRQSRIAILFSSLGFKHYFATKMADKDQQPETLISKYEARPCLWDTFSPLNHFRAVWRFLVK